MDQVAKKSDTKDPSQHHHGQVKPDAAGGRNGDRAKDPQGAIWIVMDHTQRHIEDPGTWNSVWKDAGCNVPYAYFQDIDRGAPIKSGTFLMKCDPSIYLVEPAYGTIRPIANEKTMHDFGMDNGTRYNVDGVVRDTILAWAQKHQLLDTSGGQ